jgi:hypothetical protein
MLKFGFSSHSILSVLSVDCLSKFICPCEPLDLIEALSKKGPEPEELFASSRR